MAYNRPQYNNNGNYQKKSYNNNNSSNGGTAEMISSKKDGVILKVILNNQNLVQELNNEKIAQEQLKGIISQKDNDYDQEVEIRKGVELRNQNLMTVGLELC